MSLAAKIDNLLTIPSGVDFNINTLSSYLLSNNSDEIRCDLLSHGVIMLKARSTEHDVITLSALQERLRPVVDNAWEMRKNSWSNSLINAVENDDNIAVASLISSKWRWLLGKCGDSKGYHKKNTATAALCEWCSKDIKIPNNGGFICPHCGVYFADFRPQKSKINSEKNDFYIENFEEKDEENLLQRVKKGEMSLEKTKFSRGVQPTLF